MLQDAMNAAQVEPAVGTPIARMRENNARTDTLLNRLDQIVRRVCGDYPEKPSDGVAPARPDNLVGVLEGCCDLADANVQRLGVLIDRLSSQV